MFDWFTRLFSGKSEKSGSCCGCGGCGAEGVDLGLTDAEKEALKNVDEKIVVGVIRSIRPHSNPKMTKVRVTETDTGTGPVQILCGGSNIQEGQVVAVATVGADLGGGFVIAEREIRGEVSRGMICSKEELELEKDTTIEKGIWELPAALESKLGVPVRELV